MDVKRFTARSSHGALGLVQQAFGDDALVLPTGAGSPRGERIAAQLYARARRILAAALRRSVALAPACDDTATTRVRLEWLAGPHPDVNPLPPDCPGPAVHPGRGLAAAA